MNNVFNFFHYRVVEVIAVLLVFCSLQKTFKNLGSIYARCNCFQLVFDLIIGKLNKLFLLYFRNFLYQYSIGCVINKDTLRHMQLLNFSHIIN